VTRLRRDFFARDVHSVARDLIGATLLVDGVGGRIVEVEAYHHEDPAAHGFGGRTDRNATMFGPPGRVYVYRSYGIHWCMNFVCADVGEADAVLLPLHARETDPEIVTGSRVGISKAKDLPWRYGLAGSRFLSRSFRRPG
jgi:DNA-3-methyladenine glycosylase